MNLETFISPRILILVGRVVLASLFVLAGLNKILNYNDTLTVMRDAGLEPAPLLLPITILLELGGGLLVAFGRRFTVLAAIALAVFTIATNLFFHQFWLFTGPEAILQLSLFFKNISIAGGLIYVAGISASARAQSKIS
jgi:putative oxidoreductase